jgi:hypothetical protein|tara:strand:- start:520 stop:723 length:204 start_codon:yes stop_codon:yes gene_type:complete
MTELFPGTMNQLNKLSVYKMTFTDRQLELIADAVEDYAVLIDEDAADECGEILDIIEAHFHNKNFNK